MQALGEWEHMGDIAYHVRRRLTSDEQRKVGDVIDIRGTRDASDRHAQ